MTCLFQLDFSIVVQLRLGRFHLLSVCDFRKDKVEFGQHVEVRHDGIMDPTDLVREST